MQAETARKKFDTLLSNMKASGSRVLWVHRLDRATPAHAQAGMDLPSSSSSCETSPEKGRSASKNLEGTDTDHIAEAMERCNTRIP